MAIFSNNMICVEENFDVDETLYPEIMPTAESLNSVMLEATDYMYKLMGSMYVSDIMIETAIFEGAQTVDDAEILAEATIKEIAAKAKQKFIELKNKVVAWFKQVIENMKVRFANSSTFVFKYEAKIKEAAKIKKSYTWAGYPYTGVAAADKLVSYLKDSHKRTANSKAGAAKEDFMLYLIHAIDRKADSMAELKTNLLEDFRGKYNEKNPMSPSIANTFIQICKNHSTLVAVIEEMRQANIKVLDDAIKAVGDPGDSEELKDKISRYNKCATMCTNLNSLALTLAKEGFKTFVGALKGLLTSGVKEDSEYTDEMDMLEPAGNVLETAMNYL